MAREPFYSMEDERISDIATRICDAKNVTEEVVSDLMDELKPVPNITLTTFQEPAPCTSKKVEIQGTFGSSPQPSHRKEDRSITPTLEGLQNHLKLMEKIEHALIEAIQAPNVGGTQEKRLLSHDQCQRVKSALEEWQQLDSWGEFIPMRDDLSSLFDTPDHQATGTLPLFQLRRLFPIKESGAFKEVHINGKRRKMPVSTYEGMISKELHSEINAVQTVRPSSGG